MTGADVCILVRSVERGDPHAWTDDWDRLSVRAALYAPLVCRASSGVFLPAAASSWSFNATATYWTFFLSPDVVFSDGSALTAEDVIYSLQRASSSQVFGELGTSGLLHRYLGQARYSAIDRLTVVIALPDPMADLLDLLADVAILSSHNPTAFSGRYRLVDEFSDRLVMERLQGKTSARRMEWRSVAEARERFSQVVHGTADLANITACREMRIGNDRPVRLIQQASHEVTTLFCQADRGPCVDARVRLALNLLTDRTRLINEVLNGAGAPVCYPLTPSHFGWDPLLPDYPFDPQQALGLLERAGRLHNLDLVMDLPERMPDEARWIGAWLQRSWAEYGIGLQLRVHVDRPAYAAAVQARQTGDLCCFDSSPFSSFRCLREKIYSRAAGPWWYGYRNNKIDQLLESSWAAADDNHRRGLVQQVLHEMYSDPPWLALYRPYETWLVNQRLVGWQPGSDGVMRF